MKLLLSTIAFLAMMGSVPASAEDCAPDYEGVRRATIEYEGVAGVWFAAPIARCVLERLAEHPLLEQRIGLLEGRLELRDDQVARLREVVDLAEAGEAEAVAAMEQAIERAVGAEDRARVWWRSPSFWFAAGAVLTVGVIVLAAWAWAEVSE